MPTEVSLLHTSHHTHVKFILLLIQILLLLCSETDCHVIKGHYHLDPQTHFCLSSVQSLSHVRLCDPMNRSTSGLPVHHQLPEFNQTHVHQVDDAIQPSHPLLSLSPPAPNPSQHQGLFQ